MPENFQFLVVKFSIYLNRRVFVMIFLEQLWNEPGHIMPYKISWVPKEDSDQPLFRVGSIESSLSAWGRLRFLATNRISCEESDQTMRVYRLNWGFVGRTCNLVGNAVFRLKCQYLSWLIKSSDLELQLRNIHFKHVGVFTSWLLKVLSILDKWEMINFKGRRLYKNVCCPLKKGVSLRKHAYSNILKISSQKSFQINILIFFIFLLKT